jgi:hypothetical protein
MPMTRKESVLTAQRARFQKDARDVKLDVAQRTIKLANECLVRARIPLQLPEDFRLISKHRKLRSGAFLKQVMD